MVDFSNAARGGPPGDEAAQPRRGRELARLLPGPFGLGVLLPLQVEIAELTPDHLRVRVDGKIQSSLEGFEGAPVAALAREGFP